MLSSSWRRRSATRVSRDRSCSSSVAGVDGHGLPAALGDVHGDVGAAQRLGQDAVDVRLQWAVADPVAYQAAVGPDAGDADAGCGVDPDAVDGEDVVERRPDPPRHGAGLDGVASGEHQRELVAAEPRQQVVGTDVGRSRLDTSHSSASPAAWPRVSLTSLNRSRSMSRTDTRWCAARARSSRARPCCASAVRLGRPVSGSWTAWWPSSAASRSCPARARSCSFQFTIAPMHAARRPRSAWRPRSRGALVHLRGCRRCGVTRADDRVVGEARSCRRGRTAPSPRRARRSGSSRRSGSAPRSRRATGSRRAPR